MNIEHTIEAWQKAMKRIIERFQQSDPKWTCAEHDYLGMYRFLNGLNGYTMWHCFDELKDEIAIIRAKAEPEIERARELALAA
jgi:hypothetical protein